MASTNVSLSRRTTWQKLTKTYGLLPAQAGAWGPTSVKAALAAGHAVVATGRDPQRVAAAVGEHDDLEVVKLDVTSVDDAKAAAQAAVDRFGKIDVLVNNAGNFYAGFFEEITPDDFRAQVETNLFGPLNVARAVLPFMRKQRSGLVVAISSTGGIIGQEFCSAYSASKFGIEGWIESLAPEVAPFGIRTMVVEPGFFRTHLLTADSTKYAQPSIKDYADRTKQTISNWNSMNSKQSGDPAKLAAALVKLSSQSEPPVRWVAGADAVETVEQKAKDLIAQADAYREVSSSLSYDDLYWSLRAQPNTCLRTAAGHKVRSRSPAPTSFSRRSTSLSLRSFVSARWRCPSVPASAISVSSSPATSRSRTPSCWKAPGRSTSGVTRGATRTGVCT